MTYYKVMRMYKGKRILAIIPARSGSKGLVNKNIKMLNGKPLIAYTIEAAKESSIFEDIIVSTDSAEYAEIAKAYGATVPFLRSSNLAQDASSTADVILDVIQRQMSKGKQYDYFMLLQPTSPLRKSIDIIRSIEKCIELEADSIISMCECEHPIEWCTSFDDQEMCLDKLRQQLVGRRQEKKKSYRLNGAIYLVRTKYFIKNKSMYGIKSFAYIMSKENSIDIDDIYDFVCAEAFMSMN